MRVRLANAPVSWGVEFGFEPPIAWGPMLDELRRAGYEATELGPYGYLPTDPGVLVKELERRSLRLISAFVPLELKTRDCSLDELKTVTSLLEQLGAGHVVLADRLWPERSQVAGRVAEGGVRLTESEWSTVESNLERGCDVVRGRGLRPVLHHHVGTYLETPDEVDRVLDRTSVGLCLDTGHYVYGGGDPLGAVQTHASRIEYLHLKDVDRPTLERARAEGMDFNAGVAAGVFCPLGQGCVPFAAVFDELTRLDFDGWAVVEQDVDPTGKTSSRPFEAARASRQYLRSVLPDQEEES